MSGENSTGRMRLRPEGNGEFMHLRGDQTSASAGSWHCHGPVGCDSSRDRMPDSPCYRRSEEVSTDKTWITEQTNVPYQANLASQAVNATYSDVTLHTKGNLKCPES